MMKYPIQLGTIVTVFAGLAITSLLPSILDARIGERRESIERRLFSSGGIVSVSYTHLTLPTTPYV